MTPEPKCELYYNTPYQLLVSVVLSAQTTDKMVNRCMKPLYQKGFTPEGVLALGETGLLPFIRSIGLAPTKTKNIIKLTSIIINKFASKIPQTRTDLESLPGVGRKTANVILGEIYSQPTLAVDTHVFRVTKRLGWHNELLPVKAEKALLQVIPESSLPKAHHWLILHGRYTCKARKPECSSCSVSKYCQYVKNHP